MSFERLPFGLRQEQRTDRSQHRHAGVDAQTESEVILQNHLEKQKCQKILC